MRLDTHAHRVRYGVLIFVTFTPDEAHSLIMLRLSRTRRNDPVLAAQHDVAGAAVCGRRDPPLGRDYEDDVVLRVPLHALAEALPAHDERRAIIARDALASVDGFRVLCLLAFEHLFGVRMCQFCPHCSNDSQLTPCTDVFGSNATAEGGV